MFFSKRKSQDETSGLATRVVVSGQEVVALGDLTLTGERNGTFYVKERVNVMPDSLIIGDITAVDGEISGKVSGNLVCAGELWLKSTAVIEEC
jgi:cytoskeletal protein CcmA (bactofilin family)